MDNKDPDTKCADCEWKGEDFAGASGPAGSPFVVVGEAPGRNETRDGIPFTNASAQLLDKVLLHHGVDRSSVRFTNVVACNPPFNPNSNKVEPPKEVVSACRGRLNRELDNATHVLLLGNGAKQQVLNTREAITTVRQGPPREIDGRQIVATVNPAACLFSSDYFPSLVKDVKKWKQSMEPDNVYVGWTEPSYASFEDPNDAVTVLEEIQRTYPLIAVDIECGVEKDTSFTHPDVLLSVGISYAPNKAIVIGEQALKNRRVQKALGQLLRTKKVLCHNGKYDLQVLMRVGIIDKFKLYADTMLASYVLDERPGHHGLKGLASEVLGCPDYASGIKQYTGTKGSFALIPRPILYKYNAYDVSQTFLLWEHFEKILDEDDLRRVHDMLVGLTVELAYVEYEGMAIDPTYLDELTTQYVGELSELEEQLSPWLDNPRSTPQVKQALKDLDLRAPDTAAGTLQSLFEVSVPGSEPHRFLELILEQRKKQKLYGTYVKGTRIRMIDGRVFPTYLAHGTVFGRLAARNPNIHNVPRGSGIKRLYVPEDGNIFVQCDFSQAELRVMACEAEDAYLHGVFHDESRDIHNEVSDTLYGEGNWTKELRVRTKAFVFGSAYGREPFSIASEFDIPVPEAERLYRDFMGMIPDVVRWRSEVQNQVFKEGKSLRTHFGRRRRFWLITRENRMDISKEALAFIPQSTASDLCLLSLGRIRRELGWSSHSPKIRNTVHDSILVECKKEEREEVGQLMKRIMEETPREVYSDFVPFIAEPESGPSWGALEE